MKNKKIIFISLVALILLIGVIFIYLMVYGPDKGPGGIFTNFSNNNQPPATFTDNPGSSAVIPPAEEVVKSLRQLTDRLVVGATLFSRGGETLVRYVESGTGHIYEINPLIGSEVLVSGTTFIRITKAIFSVDGNWVILISEESDKKTAFLGTINEDKSLIGRYLPPNIDNIAFTEGSVYFTTANQSGTRGYLEDLIAGDRKLLFSLPLISVRVIWLENSNHLIATKPSGRLPGFVYEIENGLLKRVVGGTRGLTVLANEGFVVYGSTGDEGSLIGRLINQETGEPGWLPIYTLPEKCTFNPADEIDLWCAWPINGPNQYRFIYPDSWYQGTHSTDDILWQVDLREQVAHQKANFRSLAGHQIDASNLIYLNYQLLFINRINNTLWLFNEPI